MSIADDIQMAMCDYQVYKEQKDAFKVGINTLDADILMLKESMGILHELVQEQGKELKTIEDEICMGKEEVASGEEELHVTSYGFITGVSTVIGVVISAVLLLLL